MSMDTGEGRLQSFVYFTKYLGLGFGVVAGTVACKTIPRACTVASGRVAFCQVGRNEQWHEEPRFL